MSNVFGYTEANLGGIFKAPESGGFAINGGFIRPGNPNSGRAPGPNIAYVQQWSAQYQQQVNPVYEVGSSKVYFAVRAASGTLNVTRIVGSSSSSVNTIFGSICDEPKDISITASENCYNTEGSVTLTMKGVIPQSVGWSGNAQNAYVQEQFTAVFASMEEG